jgi:hypothetical protein
MSSMHTRAQDEAERCEGLAHNTSETERIRGVVEDSEKAVAGCVHLGASVFAHRLSNDRVVALQQRRPRRVAEADRRRSRIDDVGEEHRGQSVRPRREASGRSR